MFSISPKRRLVRNRHTVIQLPFSAFQANHASHPQFVVERGELNSTTPVGRTVVPSHMGKDMRNCKCVISGLGQRLYYLTLLNSTVLS